MGPIFLLLLVVQTALAKTHVEEVCDSDDVECVDTFLDSLDRRGLKTMRQERNEVAKLHASEDSRLLGTAPECQTIRAALVMQSCDSGLWGQTSLVKEQVEDVFDSYECITIDDDQTPSKETLSGFEVIYVEGSDRFWTVTDNWLKASGNQALMDLATQGHAIFVNAAPNQNGIGELPFGATLHSYRDDGPLVRTAIVDSNSNLQDGLVVTNTLTGSQYAHGVIRNYEGLYVPWISDETASHEPVLVAGIADGEPPSRVLLGTMTTSNFHSPRPYANRFRKNILQSLCSLVEPELRRKMKESEVVHGEVRRGLLRADQ